jgi:hypothetical protein
MSDQSPDAVVAAFRQLHVNITRAVAALDHGRAAAARLVDVTQAADAARILLGGRQQARWRSRGFLLAGFRTRPYRPGRGALAASGGAMIALNPRAFKARADIQRALGKCSSNEAWDRVEDHILETLAELETDVRRECRREYSPEQEPPPGRHSREPGERDVEAWNDALPRSEWVMGMNGVQGPWQKQNIVYFIDPKTMSPYHWADWSVGGSIAIREMIESVKAMRRFRPGAAPAVELSSQFMNTKYGGRQRPFFEIHGWITMPGEEPQPAALAAPAAKPVAIDTVALDAGDLTPVKPVSVSEEMNDSIPF